MSGHANKYNEEFKKSIVDLHHGGKSQAQQRIWHFVSAINKWVKMYSKVKIDNDTIGLSTLF